MRALLVYCHPDPQSYTAAVRDVVLERLQAAGAEVRLLDLYARDFAPVLSRAEWQVYEDTAENVKPVAGDVEALRWCDCLIFVYPTWWYGVPAVLKGWLDRVLLPGVAFELPENGPIEPGLTHVNRLAAFTTCGASRWLTWLVGAPGKRTLLRGVRYLCAKRCKTAFVAHYAMDKSTPESRAAHLIRVGKVTDRLLGRGR